MLFVNVVGRVSSGDAMLQMSCPHCQSILTVADFYAPINLQCSVCKMTFVATPMVPANPQPLRPAFPEAQPLPPFFPEAINRPQNNFQQGPSPLSGTSETNERQFAKRPSRSQSDPLTARGRASVPAQPIDQNWRGENSIRRPQRDNTQEAEAPSAFVDFSNAVLSRPARKSQQSGAVMLMVLGGGLAGIALLLTIVVLANSSPPAGRHSQNSSDVAKDLPAVSPASRPFEADQSPTKENSGSNPFHPPASAQTPDSSELPDPKQTEIASASFGGGSLESPDDEESSVLSGTPSVEDPDPGVAANGSSDPTALNEPGLAEAPIGQQQSQSNTNFKRYARDLPPQESGIDLVLWPLNGNATFNCQAISVLTDAMDMAEGVNIACVTNAENKVATLTFHDGIDLTPVKFAEIKQQGSDVRWFWKSSELAQAVASQLPNLLLLYEAAGQPVQCALRQPRVIEDAMTLSLEGAPIKAKWDLISAPKSTSLYVEWGDMQDGRFGARYAKDRILKVGDRQVVKFDSIPGVELNFLVSREKGNREKGEPEKLAFAATASMVEAQTKKSEALTRKNLEEEQNNWKATIQKNNQTIEKKKASIRQAKDTISSLRALTPRNDSEVATIAGRIQIQTAKINGAVSSIETLTKNNVILNARIEAVPKIEELIDKLDKMSVPPFKVFGRTTRGQVSLFEHDMGDE